MKIVGLKGVSDVWGDSYQPTLLVPCFLHSCSFLSEPSGTWRVAGEVGDASVFMIIKRDFGLQTKEVHLAFAV